MNPFLTALLVSLPAALLVDRWERWRLTRSQGPFAATDFSGLILLAATAVGLWPLLPTHDLLVRLLAVGLGLLLVGALTDVWRPSRGLRLVAALAAGGYLSSLGLSMVTLKVPVSATPISLGWIGPVATALWLALSASLFARAATLPRVSLGVGAMAAATLFGVCRLHPAVTGEAAPALALALCGACLGMLAFPRRLTHRAATAGGYLLGSLVGALALLGTMKQATFLVAWVPLMVVGIPVFGAAYSWLADCVKGRRADFWARRRPHLHEILTEQGYSEAQVAGILLAGTAVLCGLTLLLVALASLNFALKGLIVLLVASAAFVVLYVILRLMRPANPPAQMPSEVNILGVRVHRVTMAEAMARVEQFIREDRPHMIVTSDAIGVMKTREDAELRAIVNSADLVTADGAGVILSARLLNMPLDVRVSGCDMVGEISKVAARLGRSVYLLGAAPGVAAMAAEKLCAQAPGLQIAACRDGYFKPEDEAEIIAEIARLKPAALFVALGIPRQEKWIKAHMAELGVPVCIGIGGSFDVISGLKKRAPRWMQRTGLEWLYRVAKEPSRLPRLWALPQIVLMTFSELLRAPTPDEDHS